MRKAMAILTLLLASFGLTAVPADAHAERGNHVDSYRGPIIDSSLALENATVRITVRSGRTTQGNGWTRSRTFIQGAQPGAKINAHLHTGPCTPETRVGGTDGHYQNEVGGNVDNVNEHWMSFNVNSRGYARNLDVINRWQIRPEGVFSVTFHRASDGKRIGCAPVAPVTVGGTGTH